VEASIIKDVNDRLDVDISGVSSDLHKEIDDTIGINDEILQVNAVNSTLNSITIIVDPYIELDSDNVMAMLDDSYNPLELLAYLDTLAVEFGELGSGDISEDLQTLESDVRREAETRQKQTRAPNQNSFD
jgi:hypothetical protein